MSAAQGATAVFEDLRFWPCAGTQMAANTPINSFAQDRQGYIWFGTQNGLSRYDGFHITTYRGTTSAPNGLADDWVENIHLDKLGNLWIGTMRGLQRYDESTDSFVRYIPTGIDIDAPDLSIHQIIDDGEDGLWIGTDGSLQHLDIKSGKFIVMRHDAGDPKSLGFVSITALVRDEAGDLWIGGAGVDRLPAGSSVFEHPQQIAAADQGNSPLKVRSMLLDGRRTLWVGSFARLDAWDLTAKTPQPQHVASLGGVPAADIKQIIKDYTGNLWIGTNHNGALYWNRADDSFRRYLHDSGDPYSIAGNAVTMFLDRTGTLWVDATDHGLQRADIASGGFTRIVPRRAGATELSAAVVVDVLEGPKNKLWLGSRNVGLLLLDPATGQFDNLLDGPLKPLHIDPSNLNAMTRDKDGKLWITTEDQFIEYNPDTQKFTVHLPRQGVSTPKRIGKILVDHAGAIWLGSYVDGLFRYDPQSGKLDNFRHDGADARSLADNSVWTIMEDHANQLWVGGISGLSRVEQDVEHGSLHFKLYRHDPRDPASIAKGSVTALFEDAEHTLWVGNDSGLHHANFRADGSASFQFFPTNNHVDAVLEDKQGRLWISTDDGIDSFDRASKTLRNYDSESDGVAQGGYFFESAYGAPDGTLYFGGSRGLTMFRPSDIKRNPYPPPVAITDFQIYNQSVRGDEIPAGFERLSENAVKLGYDVRVFSIGFSALHYASPERNQYAYRLEGFDKDWIRTDAEKRLATYTNLDPGHYVFHVKASNKDGIWNDVGTSMDIVIAPPFWHTWWFRIAAAAILGSAAVTAYRRRINALVRQKRVLESHVAQRTTDLSESNSALADANRRLGERQSELTRFLAVASHDLRQPVQALNLYLGAMTNLEDTRQMRPLLGKVHRCAQILDDMLSALLDISRLDAHVVKPENEIFPISSVFSKLSLEFAPQAQAKGLEFSVQSSGLLVQSDPNLVGQILQNLLANAVRYTRRGHIALSCRPRGDKLRVAVEDTGIGISPEQQKKVFDEFVQLGETPEGTKGLGLGLAIVKRLCNLLDVPIALESTFGRGSTFSIDLPLAGNSVEEPGATWHAAHKDDILGGKLIAAIDDDMRICDAMGVLLESWGCNVIAAASADEAIATLRASGSVPDMIVCDYRLPNETGSAAIGRLRAIFGHDIPAVLITGNTAEQIAGDAQASGLTVLHKPVAAELLHRELVGQLARRTRKTSPA